MDDQILEVKLKKFMDFFYRITKSIDSTTDVVTKMISKNGTTLEIVTLLKELNQIKIDEFELLVFTLDEISTHQDFEKSENSALKENFINIKPMVEDLILKIELELQNLETIKKDSKISAKESHKNSTRAMLGPLGLRIRKYKW